MFPNTCPQTLEQTSKCCTYFINNISDVHTNLSIDTIAQNIDEILRHNSLLFLATVVFYGQDDWVVRVGEGVSLHCLDHVTENNAEG